MRMSGVDIAAKAGVCMVVATLGACDGVQSDLVVGNLAADGHSLSFKFANDSGRSGDVVIWVEQNGMVFCERIAAVNPNYSYDVSFSCPSLRAGSFRLRVEWAQSHRDRALVAHRL